MEPIGLTASCLTIAGCAYTIIKDLHDLRAKYKHVEEVIDTLCVQVSTLRAAVTGLSIWMERKPLSAAQETNLRRELRQSLDACGTLISALQRHVSRVKGGSDTLSARGKLRHILGEDDLKEFNRMLSLQVQALSFLVQVIQLDSSKDRRWKFSNTEHQQLLARAKDDASTFNGRGSSGDSTSERSLHTTSDATDFDFDEELIRTKPYIRIFKEVMRRTIRQKTPRGTSNANVAFQTSREPVQHASSVRGSRSGRRSSRDAKKATYISPASSQNNRTRDYKATRQTKSEYETMCSESTLTLAGMSTFPSHVDLQNEQTPTNRPFDCSSIVSEAIEEYQDQVSEASNEHEAGTSPAIKGHDMEEIHGDEVSGGSATGNAGGVSMENTLMATIELPESSSELDDGSIVAPSLAAQSYVPHHAKWHVNQNYGSLSHAPSIEHLQTIINKGTFDVHNIQGRTYRLLSNTDSNPQAAPVSKLILDSGANTSLLAMENHMEKNSLHRAMQFGETELAKNLISIGTDVNCQDINGRSPLHYACESMFVANITAIELLLKAGAHINILDSNGYTPLDEACRRAPARAILFLLKKGAIVRRSSYEMLKLCQHRSEAQQQAIERALIQHKRSFGIHN